MSHSPAVCPLQSLPRRTVLFAGAGALLSAGTSLGGATWYGGRHVRVPLCSQTVAMAAAGSRVLVASDRLDQLVPGTRVLRTARRAEELVAQERAWLESGAVWTDVDGRWSDLARSALLDLHVLTLPGGVSVAGWSPAWRHVWPRDASHVAAALAATGHVDEALGILRFLQRVQRADGWFEARYLPDGSGPPDRRAPELDGTGWVLWATARLARALPSDSARARLRTLRPMLTRSTRLVLSLLDRPSGLPPASPDYWEVAGTGLTLGTAAPLAAGLSAAATVFELLDDNPLSSMAASGAQRLRSTIERGFGPDGYPRQLGGGPPDAALAFLLPPYAEHADPAVLRALARAADSMRRPAGGLAPGGGWKQDGISWTPETALFALAAAATGDRTNAQARLGWLADHRTAAGSLPEKVLYDGSPAAVAPLAWTAALVLLALAEL